MKFKGLKTTIITGIIASILIFITLYIGWPHLRCLYLFESLGVNPQGYSEYRHRQTGIVMVKLPGGRFWMGAQATDPKGQNYDPEAKYNEGPVHHVTLSPFFIGKFEVTISQWRKIMGSYPFTFVEIDNCPQQNISWDDIQKFEAITGLVLPSEAQWEYACRSGTTTPFAGKLEDMGWFEDNSSDTDNPIGASHQVGTKAPNRFGIYDMHGNVIEWCEDFFDELFYQKPEAVGLDPIQNESLLKRIFRGGSWSHDSQGCRSSRRSGELPGNESRILSVGFRPVWK